MKQITIVAVLLISFLNLKAQPDSIYLHNKTAIAAHVIRLTENAVIFSYMNEDAEQSFGKYAVRKIVYGKSGRIEKISPKIHVNSVKDWDEVIILDNHEEVAGLERVEEIRGKSAYINARTGAGSDNAALKHLKKAAAEMSCPFILIMSDKDMERESGRRGKTQSIKRAIAYSY